MRKRKFSREFKVEAVKLVKERGVSAAQPARDLGVHENVLRKWVKEVGSDPAQAFPGQGQMKPEQQEIERLRREVNKLRAERDILKKAAAFFAKEATRQGGLTRRRYPWHDQTGGTVHAFRLLRNSTTKATDHALQKYDSFTRYGQLPD